MTSTTRLLMNKVTVPVPPSLNSAYFNIGRRRAKAKCYTDWEKEAHPVIKASMVKATQPVFIEYLFTLGTSFRGDVSNRIKLVEDALVKCAILEDDNHKFVKGFSVNLDYAKQKHSTLTLTIHELGTD